MVVIDNKVEASGPRRIGTDPLGSTFHLVRDAPPMGWIGLDHPGESELAAVAQRLGLHDLAVRDTMNAHQRPKLARYDDLLFAVLRPARYVESDERVEFGELHVFIGPDYIVTVRYATSPDLMKVRKRLEASPALFQTGSEAVLYAILDAVVDDYRPVVLALEERIDRIEDRVLDSDSAVSMDIYELLRQVTEMQRATGPLLAIIRSLRRGFEKYHVDERLRRQLRCAEEHLLHVVEQVDGFWALLQNMLTVNSTLVVQRQNEETRRLTEASVAQSEEVKRISSWAAILFAPTLVAAIYGMNFKHMPESGWVLGYPFALSLMVALCVGLYLVFRQRKWL